MNVHWFRIRDRTTRRSVVVLDTSPRAASFWHVQCELVGRLAALLSPGDLPDVAFLGAADWVPYDRFVRDAAALRAAHAGRGRVTGPLLDATAADPPHRVVVCAARAPVDLDDWRHSPAADRLAFVRLDAAAGAGGACPEVPLVAEAVAGVLARRLLATRVRLPGGFPLAWDNSAYRADGADLVAAPDTDPGARIAFLAPNAAPEPVAQREWAGGSFDRLRVEPAAPEPDRPRLPLTGAEQGVLEAWRDGRAARCPACSACHAPGTVACADGGGWVLPSVRAESSSGFLRVQLGMYEATYQLDPSRAAVVGGTAVVAPDGPDRYTVWRHDPDAGAWVRTAEPWGAFEPTGGDEFLLALPAPGGS